MMTLKKGDTKRKITDALTADGEALDLTGATVTLQLLKPDGTTVSRTATVTDATAGEVEYQFVAGDTDVSGMAKMEWKVSWNAGAEVLRVPDEGWMLLRIVEAIGS